MAGGVDAAPRVIRLRKPGARLHRVWMRLLAPFHHLARADEAFAAALLDRRAELVAAGLPVAELLSTGGRRLMAERTGASESSVNVHVHKLRKAGVIKGGDFSPLFIPPQGGGGFTLTFTFEADGD